MMTTPAAITEIVNRSPYFREGLARDIINTSALARAIKQEVEDKVFRDVSLASIVTALQRLSTTLRYESPIDFRDHLGTVTVRSEIIDITYRNSRSLLRCIRKLTKKYEEADDIYFSYIKGSWQTTIICDQDLLQEIRSLCCEEEEMYFYNNVSAMSIELENNHLAVPGVMAHVLQMLAWRGITIIEVVSTADELTVVLQNSDIDDAFSTVHGYLRSGE